MPIVEAARRINNRQRDRIIEKLLRELKILKGKTIGIFGLAFKPNTDDMRDAPAVDIAQKLLDRGCRVKAHDPVAMQRFCREYGSVGVQLCDCVDDLVYECDALILATEWREYREVDWTTLAPKTRNPLILDGRHALDVHELENAGFTYISIN